MLLQFMGMISVYSGNDNKHIINFGKQGKFLMLKKVLPTYNDIIRKGKYGSCCVLMVCTCLLAYEW